MSPLVSHLTNCNGTGFALVDSHLHATFHIIYAVFGVQLLLLKRVVMWGKFLLFILNLKKEDLSTNLKE